MVNVHAAILEHLKESLSREELWLDVMESCILVTTGHRTYVLISCKPDDIKVEIISPTKGNGLKPRSFPYGHPDMLDLIVEHVQRTIEHLLRVER